MCWVNQGEMCVGVDKIDLKTVDSFQLGSIIRHNPETANNKILHQKS